METRFPSLLDVSQVFSLTREFCDYHYPLVTYYLLNTPTTHVDELHGESPEYLKRWKRPVPLRAFVQPAEQKHPLTVFGTEELRDVVLHVSTPSLIDAGLATQNSSTFEVTLIVTPGDRFFYTKSVLYDVLEWRIARMFANTDVPLFYQVNAEKVRADAASYEGA